MMKKIIVIGGKDVINDVPKKGKESGGLTPEKKSFQPNILRLSLRKSF